MPRPVSKWPEQCFELAIILALMYLVDFSANSKTSHESVKVSVPEARKVASVECSKVFLSSGSDISGMYITKSIRVHFSK